MVICRHILIRYLKLITAATKVIHRMVGAMLLLVITYVPILFVTEVMMTMILPLPPLIMIKSTIRSSYHPPKQRAHLPHPHCRPLPPKRGVHPPHQRRGHPPKHAQPPNATPSTKCLDTKYAVKSTYNWLLEL